jgi:hypothetical protein
MNPDFADAIGAPFRDRQWFTKLLIGGLMLVGSPFLVPEFFFEGYLLRVIRDAAATRQGLPEWDEWGEMLSQGAVWFAINLIYSIAAMVPIGGAVAGGIILWAISGKEAGPWLLAIFGTALLCAAGAMLLFFKFWMPAVRVHFAQTGDFGRAFAAGEIWHNLKQELGPFALAWVYSIVFWMVGAVVCVISIITIIGPVILWPYLFIVPARMFGQALAPAYAVEPGPGAYSDR